MRLAYYVYLQDGLSFSAADFETYCAGLGLQVAVDPEFDPKKSPCFMPVQFSGAFLTGFELHSLPCLKASSGGNYSAETDFERAVQGSAVVVALRCGNQDPLAVLQVYLFGAYLLTLMGGVFVNHQTGQYYTDGKAMEDSIQDILVQLPVDIAAESL